MGNAMRTEVGRGMSSIELFALRVSRLGIIFVHGLFLQLPAPIHGKTEMESEISPLGKEAVMMITYFIHDKYGIIILHYVLQ